MRFIPFVYDVRVLTLLTISVQSNGKIISLNRSQLAIFSILPNAMLIWYRAASLRGRPESYKQRKIFLFLFYSELSRVNSNCSFDNLLVEWWRKICVFRGPDLYHSLWHSVLCLRPKSGGNLRLWGIRSSTHARPEGRAVDISWGLCRSTYFFRVHSRCRRLLGRNGTCRRWVRAILFHLP